MQFHLVALTYFLLGDNDFSSRVPAVLFSIATVAVVLLGFRRYLGRAGALIGGLLFMISPYLLFYGRYTRNEAFVALFGVLTIYATLKYLEKGGRFMLYLLAVVISLQFCTKETSFIYMAQLLLFLGFVFLDGINRLSWTDERMKRVFFSLILGAVILVGAGVGLGIMGDAKGPAVALQPDNQPVLPSPTAQAPIALTSNQIGMNAALIVGILVMLVAVYVLIKSQGLRGIRSLRSFDLLILTGTLTLPQLTAFPVKFLGWDPLDYTSNGLFHTGTVLLLFLAISVVIGLWWNSRIWLTCAAAFYGIFIVLYTTFFTNGQGFFTGIIGSLGYWLSQQGVQRGSQPLYFYALIQIPIYEYLAALGAILALFIGFFTRGFSQIPGAFLSRKPFAEHAGEDTLIDETGETSIDVTPRLPVLAFLLFSSITSLVAYSFAGEKMPWLTVHIALPLLLSAGWGFGYLVEVTPWHKILNIRTLGAVFMVPVFLAALAAVLGGLLGDALPFQGKTIEQLQKTSSFLLSVIVMGATGVGVVYILKDWAYKEIISLFGVIIFAFLAVLTARAAAMASYINYDTAKEYLVYAHAARGPKDVLAQVEEISRRTTGGKDIVVAYDNDALYPYWWYFRDYPNHRWFTDKPTRDLKDAPLIISGESTLGKLEPIVKDNYIKFDYMRLWWPNQDYFNLTPERIWNAISNPEMRAAIFDIWLNRDYRAYAKLTKSDSLTLENWQPSSRMSFYIRKDVAAKMWNYGAAPAVAEKVQEDPYEKKMVVLTPDFSFGSAGKGDAQFQAPRGIVVAPDGSLYVADSRNNRIQHLTEKGELLQQWGSFADIAQTSAPGGTFNEPWGIAISPDGAAVYVTDTWNHRIQKFTATGQFVKMWGYFGQAEKPEGFWGPRGLAVDSKGRVYVTDTGNKRIVVFTSEGEFVTQFGSAGMDPGQLDEPVGLAIDSADRVYVADTWNQRIQVFSAPEGTNAFTMNSTWEVNGWFGQSLDNKPFITVDKGGNVFSVDPEGYRILEFGTDGTFIKGWGDFSAETDGFGLPAAVAFDQQGRIWVTDAGNNRVMRFNLNQ